MVAVVTDCMMCQTVFFITISSLVSRFTKELCQVIFPFPPAMICLVEVHLAVSFSLLQNTFVVQGCMWLHLGAFSCWWIKVFWWCSVIFMVCLLLILPRNYWRGDLLYTTVVVSVVAGPLLSGHCKDFGCSQATFTDMHEGVLSTSRRKKQMSWKLAGRWIFILYVKKEREECLSVSVFQKPVTKFDCDWILCSLWFVCLSSFHRL